MISVERRIQQAAMGGYSSSRCRCRYVPFLSTPLIALRMPCVSSDILIGPVACALRNIPYATTGVTVFATVIERSSSVPSSIPDQLLMRYGKRRLT
jgi:hypothetical protein